MGSWEALASFLAALTAAQNLTASDLLATTGTRAAHSRDPDLARTLGAAALELAETPEERELAYVCLAQAHFQNRREKKDLLAFEEHCRAAIDLGHAGTFCYEQLAALYEYRGDREEAAEVCRRRGARGCGRCALRRAIQEAPLAPLPRYVWMIERSRNG